VAADGTELSWTGLNTHDETFVHTRQFQFYQDTPGGATLRVVPGRGYDDHCRQRILRSLHRRLDGQVAMEIQEVESILISRSGRAIYVEQQIGGRQMAGK
jgi:hypothetical protein